jgi:acyl CoA:acetate/3-ketoacid CoA transferase beta subunit
VIEITADGLMVAELAPGISFEEVQKRSEPQLKVVSSPGTYRL